MTQRWTHFAARLKFAARGTTKKLLAGKALGNNVVTNWRNYWPTPAIKPEVQVLAGIASLLTCGAASQVRESTVETSLVKRTIGLRSA